MNYYLSFWEDSHQDRASNKLLPIRDYAINQDGNWVKHYRAAYHDCQRCPLKRICTPAAPQQKFVRAAFDAASLNSLPANGEFCNTRCRL